MPRSLSCLIFHTHLSISPEHFSYSSFSPCLSNRYYLTVEALLGPKSIYVSLCRIPVFPLLSSIIFVSGHN